MVSDSRGASFSLITRRQTRLDILLAENESLEESANLPIQAVLASRKIVEDLEAAVEQTYSYSPIVLAGV